MMARHRIYRNNGFRHKAFGLACVVIVYLTVHLLMSIQGDADRNTQSNQRRHIIKSINGDVIDCIGIYKQPAFSHPLLRNHTIQMKPSYFPGADRIKDLSQLPTDNRQLSERCPKGTVPIQRIRKAILETSSVRAHGKPYPPRASQLNDAGVTFQMVHPHEHAVVYVKGEKYHGAKASINIWNPKVEAKNEFSLAQIWVLSEGHVNAIEAGWMVHPTLYGDEKTRFFTFWTGDNYKKKGCYNTICPGFIQTNEHIPLNFAIKPLSIIGGQQYYLAVEIFRDKVSGNWWLYVQGKQVGYWPAELLPRLADGATMIEWGGEVVNAARRRHTTTEMGSGHFPEEGFHNSSYFKGIKIVDIFHNYRDPSGITPIAESPRCYNLEVGTHSGHDWGTHFFYGGPGKSPYCP